MLVGFPPHLACIVAFNRNSNLPFTRFCYSVWVALSYLNRRRGHIHTCKCTPRHTTHARTTFASMDSFNARCFMDLLTFRFTWQTTRQHRTNDNVNIFIENSQPFSRLTGMMPKQMENCNLICTTDFIQTLDKLHLLMIVYSLTFRCCMHEEKNKFKYNKSGMQLCSSSAQNSRF